MSDEKPKIMNIDPGLGESWSVTTIVGPPVEEGGDFTIKAIHEGAWGPESEGYCKARDDRTHCEHWWDGDGCCSCGAPEMTQEEMIEQGMIIPVESPEEVPVSIEAKMKVSPVVSPKEELEAILGSECVRKWTIRPFRTMTGGGFVVAVSEDADVERLQEKVRDALPVTLTVNFHVEAD